MRNRIRNVDANGRPAMKGEISHWRWGNMAAWRAGGGEKGKMQD